MATSSRPAVAVSQASSHCRVSCPVSSANNGLAVAKPSLHGAGRAWSVAGGPATRGPRAAPTSGADRLAVGHRCRTTAAACHALFPVITNRRSGAGSGSRLNCGARAASSPLSPVTPGRTPPTGVAVNRWAGAVEGRVQQVPSLECGAVPGACSVGLGGEVVAVVGQAGQPRRSVRQGVSYGDAGSFQIGA